MVLPFSQPIILENSRVRLEPLEQKHYNSLLPGACKHPTLLQYSPTAFGSKQALQDILTRAQHDRKKELRYAFAIFDKHCLSFVGSTAFGCYSAKDQRIEIGWTWIFPEVQGSGLNHTCKELLLTYAFDTLACLRVEFYTDSRNRASKKALEKLGAFYEGELRSHCLMSDNTRRNTAIYSILASEWKR